MRLPTGSKNRMWQKVLRRFWWASLLLCLVATPCWGQEKAEASRYYHQAEWGTDLFSLNRREEGSLELQLRLKGQYQFAEDWAAVDHWLNLEAMWGDIPVGFTIHPFLIDQSGIRWTGKRNVKKGKNSWAPEDFVPSTPQISKDETPHSLLQVGWQIHALNPGTTELQSCSLSLSSKERRTLFNDAAVPTDILWPALTDWNERPEPQKQITVYVAESSFLLSRPDWISGWSAWMLNEFPGVTGFDFNTALSGGLHTAVRQLQPFATSIIYESHRAKRYREAYLINHGKTATREDGFTPSHPIWLPSIAKNLLNITSYHLDDTTTPEALESCKSLMRSAFELGFSEFLMIDYVWPYWGGRWGYGTSAIETWKRYLTTPSTVLSLVNPTETMAFEQYWARFTALPLKPSTFGWENWQDFQCGTESEAAQSQIGTRKLLLFNALCHFHYLKTLDLLGDYARSFKRDLGVTVNPEDPLNGVDLVLLSRLQNLGSIGIEFFGSPRRLQGRRHQLSKLRGRNSGPVIDLIGEINKGGGGASRYDRYFSFAYYYEATATCLPLRLNIQYVKDLWPDESVRKKSGDRFSHWFAGAKAFLLRHSEEKRQVDERPKITLVSSRSVLEYQPSSSDSLSQDGSLALYLGALNYDFEVLGRDEWRWDAKSNAQVLIWSPSISKTSELESVKKWINEGQGKFLILSGGNGWRTEISPSSAKQDLTMWQPQHSQRKFPLRPLVTSPVLAGEPVISEKQLTWENETLLSSYFKPRAELDQETVLSSDNGTPMLTRWKVGENVVLLINPDLPTSTVSSLGLFLVQRAMDIAKVASVATSSRAWYLQPENVPGGQAVIIYEKAMLGSAEKSNDYKRTERASSDPVLLNVEPDTNYCVYNLFTGTQEMKNSNSQGQLLVQPENSLDFFYYGKPSPVFFKSIEEAASAWQAVLKKTSEGARKHGK